MISYMQSSCFRFLELFKIKSNSAEIEEFFTEIVKSTIEHREKENIQRPDMLQTMMELRKPNSKEFSLKKMAGNMFLFFTGAIETTVGTTLYCIYYLLRNPEALKRAHEEVEQILKKHNGEITFDAVNSLEYIDLCIKGETLDPLAKHTSPLF